MRKIRFIIIVLLLILDICSLRATRVPGYIITNNSDTIFGEINILHSDIYTGEMYFYGIKLEPFHSIIYFKEKNKSHFKSFTPNDISGFSFFYKFTDYKFKSFLIETKSIVNYEEKRPRFLNLIFQGEIAVYKDIIRKENYNTGAPDKFAYYSDLYLFDEKHGLKRAIRSKEYKSLVDLFQYFEINQKFIVQLPAKTRFKDVNKILYDYEIWKSTIK